MLYKAGIFLSLPIAFIVTPSFPFHITNRRYFFHIILRIHFHFLNSHQYLIYINSATNQSNPSIMYSTIILVAAALASVSSALVCCPNLPRTQVLTMSSHPLNHLGLSVLVNNVPPLQIVPMEQIVTL